MSVSLIIGGQWGDEGKAKIIDYLARDADCVVRYQGGANAGHTVVADGERFAFHLLPSGILYPRVICILGGGMVIDPAALLSEIDAVTKKGIDITGRVFISAQAHLVLPYHKRLDEASEKRLGTSSIGTTRKGISPAYVDKIAREGVRAGDLLRPRGELEDLLTRRIRARNKQLRQLGFASLPLRQTVADLLRLKRRLQPLVTDTRIILWEACEQGKNILLEGAQGTLLDVDHGTYPFVTSSNATAGGAVTGTGLPPSAITRVIGIFKAYCTRVGNGPFPTETKGKIDVRLRTSGNEYGTTTGRPRRCGWFDVVAARTAVKVNGVTEIALTKLDVLDEFDEIKVCTSYRIGGRTIEYLPTESRMLARCRPQYETLPGWRVSSNSAGRSGLPARAGAYVDYLESLLGSRIGFVSTGPERGEMIRRS